MINILAIATVFLLVSLVLFMLEAGPAIGRFILYRVLGGWLRLCLSSGEKLAAKLDGYQNETT